MKRVQVTWTDSITDGGWVEREAAIQRAEQPDVMNCESVGFLLADEPGYLLLATTHMRDGDMVQGVLQIPRVAVTAVRPITQASA